MTREQDLVQLLIQAKEAYYEGQPIMSDEEFDEMEVELKALNANNSYFGVVGAPAKAPEKVLHLRPMRSMQKINSADALKKWYDKIVALPLVVEEKLDGCAVEIRYGGGILTMMLTRGDGTRGTDVTAKAYAIPGIPKKLSKPLTCQIRGEIFLTTKYKESEETALRNLATGILHRKNQTENDKLSEKDLSFQAYDIYYSDNLGEYRKGSVESSLVDLGKLGVPVVAWKTCPSVEKVIQLFDDYDISLRDRLDHEIDGLIVQPMLLELQDKLNESNPNDHHNFSQVAWKFPAKIKETEILAIEWNTSLHGRVVPKAIFKPILILGATLQRAGLDNARNVRALGLRIGDKVLIKKANDIIPRLMHNKTPGHTDQIPASCPSCGGTLEDDGTHLWCYNIEECYPQSTGRLMAWVGSISKNDAKGISTAAIQDLVEAKLVKSIADLYSLQEKDLKSLQGWGQKRIDTLFKVIEASRRVTVGQFIDRLSIPLVGIKACEKLNIQSINDFLSFNDTTSVAGQNIVEWKSRKSNRLLFDALIPHLKIEVPMKTQFDKLVCFTEEGPKKRSLLIADAEKMGYGFQGNVNKNLSVLVCNDTSGLTGKLQAARKLGIPIMTYQEFFK